MEVEVATLRLPTASELPVAASKPKVVMLAIVAVKLEMMAESALKAEAKRLVEVALVPEELVKFSSEVKKLDEVTLPALSVVRLALLLKKAVAVAELPEAVVKVRLLIVAALLKRLVAVA